ncbi:hypothetical protein [Streptomyces sp. C10-9-1]|uniref:hypothetical protein n=1 Tax=Streptomyces sp. C10-9-1 TaxID=1859285 RepID=UPI003F4A1CD1
MEPQAPPPTGPVGTRPDASSSAPGEGDGAPGDDRPTARYGGTPPADPAGPASATARPEPGDAVPDAAPQPPGGPSGDTAASPPDAPEAAAAAGGPARDADAPRRPRRAAAAFLAAALALGVVGGTAVGYAVQADRAPTPLPPLAQQGLTHPAEPLPEGETIEPLPEEEDHAARTSGDLRKLLLPVPEGARLTEGALFPNGWVRLDRHASAFVDPGVMFEVFAQVGFRRAAAVSWERGDRLVSVSLAQFHPGPTAGARLAVDHRIEHLDEYGMGYYGELLPIPGSEEGRLVVATKPVLESPPPLYTAYAFAYRGDVAMEIEVYDSTAIAVKDIRSLAERQLGLL